MCGVAGILHFGRSDPVTSNILHKMNNAMLHRGPDGDGIYISKNRRIGLGHRRLSIIDLSEGASQPMSNGDGSVWISYNGEIYNHQLLRSQLETRGYHFHSHHSDTEVLVHGYEAWGIATLLEKIDGMFAFIIWDEKKNRLTFARDRIGIKPIYFTKNLGVLVIASEIKAILAHSEVSAKVNEAALYHYLTYLATPAPLTMFDGIYKLPAAHYVEVDQGGSFRAARYWAPEKSNGLDQLELGGLDEGAVANKYQRSVLERLEASVQKRMMSDAPYGAFLSGGIDSSVNVALMDRYSDDPINTFTVGYKDHQHLNELEHASKVAKLFSTNHHEVLINEKDMVGYLEELVYQQDEPLADWVCIPLHFVSKLAHENGVKVIQVGEGSDEQFCGYNSYMKYLQLHKNCFRPFQQYLPKALQHLLAKTAAKIATINPKLEIYSDAVKRAAFNQEPFWSGAIGYWETQKNPLLPGYSPSPPKGWEEMVRIGLMPKSYLSPDSYNVAHDFLNYFDAVQPGRDQLARMTYNEFRLRLPELLLMRVDKITMASSLEARVPFLDHALVELTMDIPMDVKLQNGESKQLLKKAVEGLLPNEIIYRKKMGFAAPMAQWLEGDFGKQAESEILSSPLLEEVGFNKGHISTLIKDHRTGRRDTSLLVWVLYNLTAWHRHWLN